MPLLISHSISDKGLLRSNNEDSYLSAPELGLWAVADGMGGHEAGEVASAIVKETLVQKVSQGQSLPDAIDSCHQAVLDAAQNGRGSAGMGSTVVALRSQGEHFSISWVGDSRAYRWIPEADGGRLEQLTTDHSYVQMLVASGAINESEAEHHPDRHIITQCIGSPDNSHLSIDTIDAQWGPDQWVLLCSDGLTDELDNQTLAQILCDSNTSAAACKALMEQALNQGGRDNITVQVVVSPLATHKNWRQQLPRITNNFWIDAGLYTLALGGVLSLAIWALL